MTTPARPDVEDAADEPLTRPFLTGPGAAGTAEPAEGVPLDEREQDVRPYVVTSGRVPTGPATALEALVGTTAHGRAADATYEAARLLVLCRTPRSVAELAVQLQQPVGVVRVLVADLAGAGLLAVSAPAAARGLAHDPAFLERLMSGVSEL